MILLLVYVIWVPEAEITRRVDEALTLADAQHFSPSAHSQCLSHGQKRVWLSPERWCYRRRAIYCWMNPLLVSSIPQGALRCLLSSGGLWRRKSCHYLRRDIDLIYEISDAVSTYYASGQILTHGARPARFSRTEAMEQGANSSLRWS